MTTTTKPEINAGYDQFNIIFAEGTGPIVEQKASGRIERVRLQRIGASTQYGDRVRLTGSGTLMRKDGSDGLAVRSYVRFSASDVPQDLLTEGLVMMQARAAEHAVAVAGLTVADFR